LPRVVFPRLVGYMKTESNISFGTSNKNLD